MRSSLGYPATAMTSSTAPPRKGIHETPSHEGWIAAKGLQLAAGVSLVAAARSSRCEEAHSGRPARAVRAHYLRPDPDELPLLEAVAVSDPLVQLSWGETLPIDHTGLRVLITRLPTGDELDALAPDIEALIVPFAGPVEKTKNLIRERPQVSLHNCHFNATSTAELAVALFMSAVKRVVELDARMRREILNGVPWTAGWEATAMDCPTLSGRTAVVLGYGAIGCRVAKVLQALGMEVHVVRRRLGRTEEVSDGAKVAIHGVSELDDLLPRAFALFICLPGTTETANLIGRAQIRALPRGAVLVNVGRGSVVDEAALFEALKDKHLGAAGLDVWYNYPMLPGSGLGAGALHLRPGSQPFHELGNVVMSPHRGQSSDTKAKDRVAEVMQMLGAMARTGHLPNRFDLSAGY